MIGNPAIAIILPARDEETALAPVLTELLPHAVLHRAVVAVGLNDCRDRSRTVAEAHGVLVGETMARGYGHGCLAAIAANWPRLGYARAVFNVLLGAWAGVLSGKFYRDLGPFRLIDRQLFERIAAQETAWGWTIEPQVVAPRLGVRAVEVSVSERPRIAGEQKVTGVSLGHTLRIGLEIIRAGWRCRMRELPPKLAAQ